MVYVDRVFAAAVAAFTLTVFIGAFVLERSPEYLILGAIGLAPAGLALIPRVWSMLLVMVLGLPCCVGSWAYCDAATVPGLPGRVLHQGHDWVFFIGVYGFVRACQLGDLRKGDR